MGYMKPTEIMVSGNVVTDKWNETSGDIYIYRKDDRDGRKSRQGNHTNHGYSGYYLASIFDGKDWRKLQFNKLIPYEQRSYELARQSNNVVCLIKEIINSWQGELAEYDSSTRSFRIRTVEMEINGI